MPEHTVKIYSTPTCVFCKMAREFFTTHNIPFEDYDVSSDEQKRNEMIERSGQMGVPVIDIDGELIIGFDEERIREKLGVGQ